jgi:hypothetical protein
MHNEKNSMDFFPPIINPARYFTSLFLSSSLAISQPRASAMSINRHFAEESYGKDVVAASKGATEAKTLTEQSMTVAWALTSKTASALYSASSFAFSKAKEVDEAYDISSKTASALGTAVAKAIEVDEKFNVLETTSDVAKSTMKKVAYGVGVAAKLAAGK